MGFVKVLKNKAYSSRYQTKFRRRREGKTDYYARRRLVVNAKDKYDSKKYRFVVRRTNRRIIAHVVYSTITGDHTMVSADSFELRNYGIEAGLTNYSAAYATGLLAARRLLALKKMDDLYKGQTEVDGKLFSVYDNIQGDRRPFKAFLDVGLVRTTTGNRVFGAMKGACDGGLYIPHNEKRFPGYRIIKAEATKNKRGKKEEKDSKSASFNAEEHAEHIFGEHVEAYYEKLQKENAQLFKKQFSHWQKAFTKAGVEDFWTYYKNAHEKIRKNPARAKVVTKGKKPKVLQAAPTMILQDSKGRKWLTQKKIGLAMRRQRVQARMAQLLS